MFNFDLLLHFFLGLKLGRNGLVVSGDAWRSVFWMCCWKWINGQRGCVVFSFGFVAEISIPLQYGLN